MTEQRMVIRLYEDEALVFSTEVTAPVELGRQQAGERAALLVYKPSASGAARVVVAKMDDVRVSRRHALLEPHTPDRIKVTNVSNASVVGFEDGTTLAPGAWSTIGLPARLTLGGKVVSIGLAEARSAQLEGLERQPVRPVPAGLDSETIRRIAVSSGKAVDTEAILRWLQTTVVVLQSAATSKDFLSQVARAVVEVGLDNGAILMRAEGGWTVRAFYSEAASTAGIRWHPSQRVLTAIAEQKRTLWRKPESAGGEPESLFEVEAVVAAPILDRSGEVTGVVYGDRRAGTARVTRIGRVEAMLVELLACGVAAGFARLEQEQVAVAARVRFEEFFTPELSRELEADPDLLKGKDTEVTILVVDIRGFSRISERLGPAKTVDWIRDVMQVLSNCVLDHQGVLVDYVGDEIMAMWGAPKEQPEHAAQACRAGLDMLRALPELNERWQTFLGEPLEIGIGINTGLARVGNVGSDRKFKYGPLGSTVNLASRVEGATKYLGARIILTGATHSHLGPEFLWRRLCRVQVLNIKEPVDLYELGPAGEASFSQVQGDYEKALVASEQGRFEEAAALLGHVLAVKSNDGPSRVLMARVLESLTGGATRAESFWTLPGK